MSAEKLKEKIKNLEKQVETKDKEIMLLRAILDALQSVRKDRSAKEDKEKLKELEAKLNNL